MISFLIISIPLHLLINFGVSNLTWFLVVSNRLWAHTKQEKEHCVVTRKIEVLWIGKKNCLLKLNLGIERSWRFAFLLGHGGGKGL